MENIFEQLALMHRKPDVETPLDAERHRRAVLIALLVIAFVLRLTAALSIPLDYRLRDDAVEYVTDARNLLAQGILKGNPSCP